MAMVRHQPPHLLAKGVDGLVQERAEPGLSGGARRLPPNDMDGIRLASALPYTDY